MKSSNQLFVLSILSVVSSAAAAEGASGGGQAAVDTSKWKCELCKFEQGLSGTVDVGDGNVSGKAGKFSDYTGLDDKRIFFIGDGALRSRGENGTYWNLNASNLGLKSRSLDSEAGQQGKYKLLLKYDELPHFISDSALTPFVGSGGASLTLPAGFPQPATSVMPLASTLQQLELGTQRKRLGVGASWIPVRDWEFALNVRHETKEGTKRIAGSFVFNASELVQPVDYVTDQVDASASYTGGKLQAKFAYYGSVFRNRNDSLTWQNPFAASPPAGQLGLPPDNQFHQLLASAGYQFSDRTRASADIAVGRMTQNEEFLPFGAAIPGPGGSLTGRAATLDVGLKLNSALTDRLRLNAALTHNDRHNDTPQATYPYVTTDAIFLGTPRTNLPYSFAQDKLKLSADYKASASTKASVGVDHDAHRRTYQEVDRTRENTVWGKITNHTLEKLDLTLKLAHAERTNSGYKLVSEIPLPVNENPLLRKYNLADRTRDNAALRADIEAAENVNVALGVEWSKDRFTESSIGLNSGRDFNVNGDVTLVLTPQTSLHFFANHQEIESTQFGSNQFGTSGLPAADWSGRNKDKVDLIGLGVKHSMMENKVDIGGDYTIMRSKSKISVDNGLSGASFPDLSTSLNSLKLYATYHWKENLSLQAAYWHEHYDSKDWMLDGVTPSTISNVLSLGLQPPQYRVNVIKVSARYKF